MSALLASLNPVFRVTRWLNGYLQLVLGWIPATMFTVIAGPLAYWAYHALGVERRDRILLVVGLGALIVAAICVALVVIAAVWLRLRREAVPTERLTLDAGTPTRTGFVFRGLGWIPLLRVDLSWEKPANMAVHLVSDHGRLVEEVTAAERGQFEEVVRCYRVADVFGIARIAFRRRTPQEIIISPSVGRVEEVRPRQQFTAGDTLAHPEGSPTGDLIEMRRYSPGDPLKLVLWKVYARTGRMLVRTPERAVSPVERILAYLVAGAADEPAAGLARIFLERGSFGRDFLFQADGSEQPTNEVRQALEQVRRSVEAREAGATGLGELLDRSDLSGMRTLMLFVPCEPGAWLDRVEETLASRAVDCQALVGIDGLPETHTTTNFLRCWLRKQPAAEAKKAERLRTVVERLQAAGAVVNVLDRLSGEKHEAFVPHMHVEAVCA